jgi:glycosyltransferase involved in cell wall biosynthesis
MTLPPLSQDRQLVSFALFTYNQEKYVREAVEGAFSQTYEPLEIILSDDCSSDRTFEIMQEMAAAYDGAHEVSVRRNEVNMGLAGHVNTVAQHIGGEILLLAAGDDVSLPDRTCISVDILKKNPSATAALLSANIINHSGKIIGELVKNTHKGVEHTQTIFDLLTWKHVTFGATRAVRREVFTKFAPLTDCCPTEDTPLLLRSLILGTNIISQQKAILYRQHDSNLSGAESMKRMNTAAIYQQYKIDIDAANDLNLITDVIATKLREWLPLDRKIRALKLDVSLNRQIGFRDAVFYVRHPSTKFCDKVKFIINYLTPSKVFTS